MNLVEYLLLVCAVALVMGTGTLIHACRNAEDAFQNELGFQLGIAPPVKSLDSPPAFIPLPSPPAMLAETVPFKPRRPPSSKPPMLPVGMTAADFDTRQTGAPWSGQTTDSLNPPVSTDSPVTNPIPSSGKPDTTAKS